MTGAADALEWLYGLQVHGMKLGLTNITELLRRLGDPQDSFRSIHVAGSDGKGSTAAFAEAVLRRSGLRTGLYTSPHLVDFNERIRVSGRMIGEDDLARLAALIRPEAEEMAAEGMRCTFFEAATALAFAHFRDEGVDIAVIEVGMGGRFDATNVITPEACVITNISLEHTGHLGTTLTGIAREKAGIIKPGVPCATMNGDEVSAVLSEAAAAAGAPLTRISGDDIAVLSSGRDGLTFAFGGDEYSLQVPGRHQAGNAALALTALSFLDDPDGRIRDSMREGLAEAQWPCRMQQVRGLPLIIDSTHTGRGAEDLAADIGELYGRVLPVLGVLDDKDVGRMAAALATVADRVVVTAPDSERAMPADKVAEAVSGLFGEVLRADGVAAAMDAAVAARRTDEMILVTGSLHMAGEALQWLRKMSS